MAKLHEAKTFGSLCLGSWGRELQAHGVGLTSTFKTVAVYQLSV